MKHIVKIIDKRKNRQVLKEVDLNIQSAVRGKCIECSGGAKEEVKYCPIETCYLWPFREEK